MIVTFKSKEEAEKALIETGYKNIASHTWVKNGFEALVHPINFSEKVQVSFTKED